MIPPVGKTWREHQSLHTDASILSWSVCSWSWPSKLAPCAHWLARRVHPVREIGSNVIQFLTYLGTLASMTLLWATERGLASKTPVHFLKDSWLILSVLGGLFYFKEEKVMCANPNIWIWILSQVVQLTATSKVHTTKLAFKKKWKNRIKRAVVFYILSYIYISKHHTQHCDLTPKEIQLTGIPGWVLWLFWISVLPCASWCWAIQVFLWFSSRLFWKCKLWGSSVVRGRLNYRTWMLYSLHIWTHLVIFMVAGK